MEKECGICKDLIQNYVTCPKCGTILCQTCNKGHHCSNDYTIKDSGQRTEFITGAHRDLGEGKGRFDLLPAATIRALAIHYQKGCNKYGERNWEKGIPISKYLDSGLRHAFQVLVGMDD